MSVSKSLKKQPLMCLCLKKADGQKPGSCMTRWEDGALLGEYMTRNSGESPSVAVESRLSAILEECAHQKYYLSAKACEGILRRATRRGKELPKPLLEALKNHATVSNTGVCNTLPASMGMGGGYVPMVTEESFSINGDAHESGVSVMSETSHALKTTTKEYVFVKAVHENVAQPVQYRVRRLTPLECTRLQGFPDGWVDIGDWVDSKGKKHKEADAPKYKALGNSIALPFWKWLLARIRAECEAESFEPTLGSLFDGIGGFPLSWPGRTAWSIEIEEFPLAVLRARFGEGMNDDLVAEAVKELREEKYTK